MSSTFHVIQNNYQKNIRNSDFYKSFLILDYLIDTRNISNRVKIKNATLNKMAKVLINLKSEDFSS